MKSQPISRISILAVLVASCSCERAGRTVTEVREAYTTRRAASAAKSLAGYDVFKSSFRLERDPTIGCINGMPESLFLEIEAAKSRSIDAAWWWNPLSNGIPASSWHDFVAAFSDAERIVARHAWLANLKDLEDERSLELHLLGAGVGVHAIDLERWILPAWKHAGMAGRPQYCLLARRGNSWVELIFSDVDDRAVVCKALTGEGPPRCPIDSLTLKASERSWQYAIISPDGSVVIHTIGSESAH